MLSVRLVASSWFIALALVPWSASSAADKGPDPSTPLPVQVRLRVDNLVSIDEQRETWQVTGELTERWRESKFAYVQRGPKDRRRDLPASTWRPELRFVNEAAPASLVTIDLYARPNGRVVAVQRFNVTLSTQLDLRRFPFDEQRLPIVIEPRGHDADRVLLSADIAHSDLAKAKYAELSQWRSPALSARVVTHQREDYAINSLVFTVSLHRGSNSYVWKFLLPLFLIVLLSWVSFWLSPEEFKTKDQLGTLVSTLLIIVAFNITATASLPRTNYVTYIDAFLLACFMFVVLAIGAVVTTHTLQIRHRDDAALAMRRLSGTFLPITFVIAQLALLALFFHG